MSFDRRLVRHRRARACFASAPLFFEVAALICDRVAILLRNCPVSVLILGCRNGLVASELSRILPDGSSIVQCDVSLEMLAGVGGGLLVVADDEALPFRDCSFDFVISNLSLHNVNDLARVFARVRAMLRDGGAFVAATFGSGTLYGIKKALASAEGLRVAPRIQPFHSTPYMLECLQLCGLSGLVAEVSTVEMAYNSLYDLFHGLKNMGEGNTIRRNYEPLSRNVMERAWGLYKQSTNEHDAAGAPVQFEIVVLKGNK
ncbi:methyltransferase domain-containing protein [Anaplasma marginale]|uniref:methyltransferase domain-containing protein n=1 Tax=Anaplasma marginale TaxID=770 RepID=UPI000E578A0C|nr:methyltransferase domain-containing protein [Anaplasma marginale]AXW83997.1 SAM-dependent methyltransferase [Anaplasma marginale]